MCHVALLAVLGGCSGGWSGVAREQPSNDAARSVAPSAPARNQGRAPPGTVAASGSSASSSLALLDAPSGPSPRVEGPPCGGGAVVPNPAPPLCATASAKLGVPADGVATPVLTAELRALRRAAQDRVLGTHSAAARKALHHVDPTSSPLPWDAGAESPALVRFVAMENEAALKGFHQALARLAKSQDTDGKVRILAYGASHTQADIYPAYLRTYLQSRFGNGGQGFVLLGRVNRWHRVAHTRVRQRGLTVDHARFRREAKDIPLGLFGAALVGRTSDGFAEVVIGKSSSNTRFRVHYFKQPGGGNFDLVLDGKNLLRVATNADTPGPAEVSFETTPGAHTIRTQLRGSGPVRLFGISAETARPGVVIDTLGIGGADMASQLRWEEDVWSAAVRARNPDLVTFAYGTNETMDAGRSPEIYEGELRAVLARFRRALPETSCVLISPFDVPNAWHARLVAMLETQRRVSREFRCAFWDGYAFMGGEGAMRRWVRAKPPLATRDHIHLTPLGYVYAGRGIGDALMRAYDAAPDALLRPPSGTPAATSAISSGPEFEAPSM